MQIVSHISMNKQGNKKIPQTPNSIPRAKINIIWYWWDGKILNAGDVIISIKYNSEYFSQNLSLKIITMS